MQPAPPVIVTLNIAELDYFTNLRRQHFPRHVNFLDAHLTLFHVLPSDQPRVTHTLENTARRKLFTMQVAGIKNMGNGVAFEIQSGELQQLHQELQLSFAPWLINQDRKKLWPHITIQNKVTAYKASQLAKELSSGFRPFSITATGLSSWIYRKGPWEPLGSFNFQEG